MVMWKCLKAGRCTIKIIITWIFGLKIEEDKERGKIKEITKEKNTGLSGCDCHSCFCKDNIQTAKTQDAVALPVEAQWEYLYPFSCLHHAVCFTQGGFLVCAQKLSTALLQFLHKSHCVCSASGLQELKGKSSDINCRHYAKTTLCVTSVWVWPVERYIAAVCTVRRSQ